MQRFFYTLMVCLAFCFTQAQTVYIAETGLKYHTKNCPAVKNSAKAIELKEARKKGYEPCTSCGADKIQPKEEKLTEKKKQEAKVGGK